jgi:flagellar M-ring protein FliF
MDLRQFQNLYSSLKGLGRQRLMALGAAGILVFALISIGSYFASRSTYETLYVGLTPPDISSMGRELSQAGIPFQASSDGTKLGVPIGQAEQARALLAEKGLPGSPNAGYELFDKLGALGLTSFMQEVTRVRAIEGELSRTIQYLKGIRAARVHLFLPDQNALRTSKQTPTASVVIKTDVAGDATAAPAIKHLVAAAIPDMKPDEVQVIGTDGTLLGANGGPSGDAPVQMLDLERTISKQLQDSVRRALSPYLGIDNFEVSAIARLNIDKHQTTETKYDPESKVERSTRVIKEAQSSSDGSGRTDVSVEQNIPNEAPTSKEQSKRAQDRKEETTNYEISSKSASTTSEGYKVDNISLAVVVNKKRLAEIIGKDAKSEDVDKQVAEIEKLALSAAGLDTKRGDRISVAAVEFAQSPLGEGGSSGGDWTVMLMALAGTGIKSLTILLVAAIVVLAGFRPAMRTLLANGPAAVEGSSMAALAGPGIPDASGATTPLDMPEMASPLLEPGANPFDADFGSSGFAGDGLSFGRSLAFGPVEKLGAIIDRDEEQATAIMKHWVKNG